jgi:hypothetical protein
MTMPDERTRSLRWGFEFLGEMLSDETIEDSIRAAAQRLLLTYPRPEQILEWIEADAPGLPQAATEALVDASALWTRLQFSSQGTQETRHTLMFVQRHFPEPWLSQMLGAAPIDGLRSWLLPEDWEYGRDAP